MFQQVEETADARRLSLFDQLLAPGADQQGLHVTPGLSEIEKFTAIRTAAHFDDSSRLVEFHVGQRARRHIEVGRAAAFRKLHNLVGEAANGAQRLLVFSGERYRLGGFLCFSSHDVICHFRSC